MRNALKIMTASLAAMALSASCAVHEWPETLPADATLKLDFDTALPQFIVLDLNDTRGSVWSISAHPVNAKTRRSANAVMSFFIVFCPVC